MAKKSRATVIMKERKRWGLFGLPFTFTVYSITDKKLLIKQGFLNRKYDEIMLYRITDLQRSCNFVQSVFGFGLGTVTIFSKDTSDSKLVINNIRHYEDFYECLSESIERERLRYNVRPSELIGTGLDGHPGHESCGDIDLDGDGIADHVDGF